MVNKCLKEWNATVEALGNGLQTILIRKSFTTIPNFLLYPSVRYSNKNNFIDQFNPKYHSFVEENTLPNIKNNRTEIKYYAMIENFMELNSNRIGSLKKNYIWTKEHVQSYLDGNKAHVWILRIYKLKEPYLAAPSRAMTFVNLKKDVSLSGLKPVLTDKEYNKVVNEIKYKGKFIK